MLPLDGITVAKAARILGVTTTTVRRMVLNGQLADGERHAHRRLSRAEVERVAVARYRRNDRIGYPPDPDSYWVTRDDAAAVLGVAPARIGQLARAGRIHVRDCTRRHQAVPAGAAAGDRQRPRLEALG